MEQKPFNNNNRNIVIQQDNGGFQTSLQHGAVNIGRLLRVLLSRWYWIVISFVIAMTICYFYLKATQPKFQAEGIMKYNTEKQQTRFPDASALLGNDFGGSEDYLAEIYSIKSYSVLSNALDSIGYNLSFYSSQGLRDVNIYPQRPVVVKTLLYDIDKYKDGEFKLSKKGNGYVLQFENKVYDININFGNIKAGDTLTVPGLQMLVIGTSPTRYEEVKFKYMDYWQVKSLGDGLIIKEAERELPILKATFTSNNLLLTRNFLKATINSYLAYDLEVKRLSSEQTITFINEQLNTFEGLLKESSSRLEVLKKRYDLVDVQSSSQQYLLNLTELRTSKYNLEIQMRNMALVAEDVRQNREVVSNTVGLDGNPDPMLSGLVTRLNELRFQRRQQLVNFAPESSIIKNIDDEIASLKTRIGENVRSQQQQISQAMQVINTQLAAVNSRIGNIPTAERDLVYLTSDVDVNKNIYSILLNKKLETAIEKAGVVPSFTVIDYPKLAVQIFPRTVIMTIVFAALGLAAGIGLILLKRGLNNKFSDMTLLNRMAPRIPILGVINHYSEDAQVSETTLKELFSNRSVFTETVNAIRTNVAYITNNGAKKVITITSEVSGEGKSFVSLNLSVSLTKLNKKVIIVASDLRRSKLHRYFNNANRKGLSTYLASNTDSLDEVITTSAVPGLDYMTSGPVPINPSELIYQERFWKMLELLKARYDFIILDTAPIGLVSDSLPILRQSDVNIFVLRWLYSSKQACSLPAAMVSEMGIQNLNIIVNDFKHDELYGSLNEKDHYGSYSKYYTKYDAYYGSEEVETTTAKTGLRRIFKMRK